jgi:hypothetical protein
MLGLRALLLSFGLLMCVSQFANYRGLGFFTSKLAG